MLTRRNVTRPSWFIAITTLPLLLTACVPSVYRHESRHLHALLLEQNPGGEPPTHEAAGLREPANRVPEGAAPPAVGRDDRCPSEVSTFVRAEVGFNCQAYKAEIAGWASRCVKECNDAARLAEAVASAQVTCAAFCKKKRCPGPAYAPPARCAASDCYKSELCDPEKCPLKNYCMLLQGTHVWNCVCIEV